MKTQAKRYDQGKPELHYLDPWFDALGELCQVCMKGAEKYERGNYLLGQGYSQLLSAAYRHIMKFGSHLHPDTDPESGRHHIAHAIWNLLQLLQHEVDPNGNGDLWDDRLVPPRNACVEVWEGVAGIAADRAWVAGEPPPIHGDDDSRDPADYEQETADMMAAAQGTGRKAHPPWQDAIESWLTGEPDPEDVWNPNDHLIQVDVTFEPPGFKCRRHGDELRKSGSCPTCDADRQRRRNQAAQIRAKL